MYIRLLGQPKGGLWRPTNLHPRKLMQALTFRAWEDDITVLSTSLFTHHTRKCTELKTLEWDILNPDLLIWVSNVHCTFDFTLNSLFLNIHYPYCINAKFDNKYRYHAISIELKIDWTIAFNSSQLFTILFLVNYNIRALKQNKINYV